MPRCKNDENIWSAEGLEPWSNQYLVTTAVVSCFVETLLHEMQKGLVTKNSIIKYLVDNQSFMLVVEANMVSMLLHEIKAEPRLSVNNKDTIYMNGIKLVYLPYKTNQSSLVCIQQLQYLM